MLSGPFDVVTDKEGNLCISVVARIRKVNTSGIISTVVGNGVYAYRGDGGL